MTRPPRDRQGQPNGASDLSGQLDIRSSAPATGQTPTEERRDYLFDMLGQLAIIAASCGETGIEMILKTIVLSRGAPLSPPISTAKEATALDEKAGSTRKNV